MGALSAFFERNIGTVFFVYGLAFFSMGLAVWLESRRASEFRIARAMGPLAGFGIIHGFHEWIEMFQRMGHVAESNALGLFMLDVLRLGILALSFLLLMLFGARLIFSNDKGSGDGQAFTVALAGVLIAVWLGSVSVIQRLFGPSPADFVAAVDVLTRYALGVPSALLAAWAMVLEQRAFRARGMPGFGRDLLWAALALFLYGIIGQTFPKQSFLFPSTIINADLFLKLFGMPVQLFRAFAAAVVAVFVIRALRAFELESQQRLAAAHEARLAAQREALETQRRAQAETEQLNRELRAVVQDLFMLFELSRSLASTLDRETLLKEAIANIARSVPRIEAGMILLQEKPNRPPKIMASSGYPSEAEAGPEEKALLEQARSVGQYVVKTGKPAWSVNGQMVPLGDSANLDETWERTKAIAKDGGRTLGVPLMMQNRVAGSLVLSVSANVPPLTPRDLSLISTVAGQLSIAIENATLYREVQDREALRGELLRRVVSAQEQERQRIARELHDGPGQALTALGLGLAAASESLGSDPALDAQRLTELRTLSAQALEELHHVVSDLRPSVLDDLGLVPALRGQIQDFESRTGVRAQFMVSGRRRRVRGEIETILFRIAQESLTNIAKHAAAQTVTVQLTFTDDALELAIQDDGRGFDPDEALRPGVKRRPAWGLLGIQERVALVGGTCQIKSQPGAGTTIQVRVPLLDEGTANAQHLKEARYTD